MGSDFVNFLYLLINMSSYEDAKSILQLGTDVSLDECQIDLEEDVVHKDMDHINFLINYMITDKVVVPADYKEDSQVLTDVLETALAKLKKLEGDYTLKSLLEQIKTAALRTSSTSDSGNKLFVDFTNEAMSLWESTGDLKTLMPVFFKNVLTQVEKICTKQEPAPFAWGGGKKTDSTLSLVLLGGVTLIMCFLQA